jgi:hypothetical protein
LVAAIVTLARQFVFVSVSALSYVVASRGTHTFIFFYCTRSLAVTGSGGAVFCTIANVTLPGSFIIRRSTRGRV